MRRLSEIRTAALIAGIAALLSLLVPAWDAARRIVSIDPRQGTQWVIPFVALVYPLTAILPVFLFALYRNRGALLIPRRLGVLAVSTAVVYAILVASWLQDSIRDTSVLLGELSNRAYILLLIALFRNRSAEAQDVPVSHCSSETTRCKREFTRRPHGPWS